MKFLAYLQTALQALLILILIISVLTILGIINPVRQLEAFFREDIIIKLRADAESGDIDAQNKLGTILYIQAQEQHSSFDEAIIWLEIAHQQNNPIAELNLAFAYKSGHGVKQDRNKAIELYYQAGLNFLQLGFPMDAKDCVYEISKINTIDPLKRELINAIKAYEAAAH